MACETYVQAAKDAAERERRARDLADKTKRLSTDLASGKVKVKISPEGAIAFDGWVDRGPVTDACAYRRIMSSGSALAKAAITRAEQLSNTRVNRRVVDSGVHSHDGGKTWGTH